MQPWLSHTRLEAIRVLARIWSTLGNSVKNPGQPGGCILPVMSGLTKASGNGVATPFWLIWNRWPPTRTQGHRADRVVSRIGRRGLGNGRIDPGFGLHALKAS